MTDSAFASPRIRAFVLIAIVAVGALLRVGAAWRHVSIDYDEGRYLDNAVNLLEGRGLASLYTSHYFRETTPIHPEDMSAPLYPWMLAAAFTVTGAEHRVAQAFSVAAGVAMIVLTWAAGRRFFDDTTAILGATMVALHPDLVILSSWAMTETLYGALFLGILMLFPGRTQAGGAWPRAAILGASCGALYLLRANGLAVAAAVGLAILLDGFRATTGLKGWNAWRRPLQGFAIFAIASLAVVGPWLARNARVFGSPTWSAMKHVAWTETGKDLFTRGGEPPSASRYLRENGAIGLAKNLARRALRVTEYFIWGDSGGFNLFCALFPLALLLSWNDRGLSPGHLASVLTAALLLGVPLWTGALSRYMSPMRPWMYLTVIGVALRLASRHALGGGRWRSSAAAAGSAAIACCTLIAALSFQPLRDYIARDDSERDASAVEASEWLRANTPKDAVILEGAWVHQYAFIYRRAVVWTPAGGLDALRRAAADFGAEYFVASDELLRFHPELHSAFGQGIDRDPPLAPPAGFSEVFAGKGRRIVIYRLGESRT